MRALVALMLLTVLVPLSAAAPFDCTGAGVPTSAAGTGLTCDRSTSPGGDTTTTREIRVNADNDVAGARIEYRHQTTSNPDRVQSSCRLQYVHTDGLGVNSFNMFPPCASHRVLA